MVFQFLRENFNSSWQFQFVVRISSWEVLFFVRISLVITSIPRGDFLVRISVVRNSIPDENSRARNPIRRENFNSSWEFFVTISPVRNAIPRENSPVRNSIPCKKFNFFVRMSFLSWLENVRKHPDRQIDFKAQVLVYILLTGVQFSTKPQTWWIHNSPGQDALGHVSNNCYSFNITEYTLSRKYGFVGEEVMAFHFLRDNSNSS